MRVEFVAADVGGDGDGVDVGDAGQQRRSQDPSDFHSVHRRARS